MTQENFDKLPGLLSLSQFIGATGLSDEKVRAAREAGYITTYRPPPVARRKYKKSRLKYYKRDAARLGGFEMR